MSQNQVTILVVDDEVDLCELVAMRLEREGYRALKANSGNEAIKLIEKEDIDLVISDVRMPDGDGATLLDRSKSMDPRKPAFLFITGYSDIALNEAYNKGAEALLSKPIDFSELIEIVRERLINTASRFNRKAFIEDADNVLEMSFDSLPRAVANRDVVIGNGGLFIGMDKNFPKIQETIHFRIDFQDGLKLVGKGVCRWTRIQENEGHLPGIGIEFVQLDDDTAHSISSYVNENKIRAYIPLG